MVEHSYDGCEYALENWKKYNDRNDVKKSSWVRFEHDFFESETFEGFTPGERIAWLYLLCGASKKNGESKRINYANALRIAEVASGDLTSALTKLQNLQVLIVYAPDAVRTRAVSDPQPTRECAATLRTNVTDETNVTDVTSAPDKKSLAPAGPSGNQTPVRHVATRPEVAQCMAEWKLTLEHFKIDRGMGMRDEVSISRGIQDFGAEWVRLAMIGARKQVKGPKFDPAQFVSLASYLHKDKIERLVNIGSGKESSEGMDWGTFWANRK